MNDGRWGLAEIGNHPDGAVCFMQAVLSVSRYYVLHNKYDYKLLIAKKNLKKEKFSSINY